MKIKKLKEEIKEDIFRLKRGMSIIYNPISDTAMLTFKIVFDKADIIGSVINF